MRSVLCVVIVALCLIALQCTADEEVDSTQDDRDTSVLETSDVVPPAAGNGSPTSGTESKDGETGRSSPAAGVSVPRVVPDLTAQSGAAGLSSGSLSADKSAAPASTKDNSLGTSLGDDGTSSNPVITKTTTTAVNADPANTRTLNEPSEHVSDGLQPKVDPGTPPITQAAGTNGQTELQPQITPADREQTDAERQAILSSNSKPPNTPSVPPPAPKIITTTISPNPLTVVGVVGQENPHERESTDNTINSGDASQQQRGRLEQPHDTTVNTPKTQAVTRTAATTGHQDHQSHSAGTAHVSPEDPKVNPVIKYNTPARGNTPQTTTPATAHQLQTPEKGQTTTTTAPSDNAATPTNITTGDKKINLMQTSVNFTSVPEKGESTPLANNSEKLSKAIHSLDTKDSSISVSFVCALAALATLVLVAVAPAL